MMIKMKALLFLSVLFVAAATNGEDQQHQRQEDRNEGKLSSYEAGITHRRAEDIPSEKLLSPEDYLQQQIEGERKSYIIVFKDSDEVSMAMTEQTTLDIVERAGGVVKQVYNTALKGMAATLTEDAMKELKQNEGIKSIGEDEIITVSQETIWGLDRVDQADLPLDNSYRWARNINAGAGINVCVIDTGIDEDYLNGNQLRIGGGVDFTGIPEGRFPWNDCNGHGTHVAGTVGSRSYGVAPGVTVWAVRVLGCSGSGLLSSVIAGVDWCTERAVEEGGKWVGNMSLGGGLNTATNEAVANARANGVIMVVAAGNFGGPDSRNSPDACNYSPGSEPTAITVASSNRQDLRSIFSNTGPCVDIFGPGSEILSLWLTEPGQVRTLSISGTSMASPHVAGAAALFFQNSDSAVQAEQRLIAAGVMGRLNDVKNSVNRLVQVPGNIPAGTTPSPTRPPIVGPPTQAPTAPPPAITLPVGQTVNVPDLASGQTQVYQIIMNQGDSADCRIRGSTGDADLYLRFVERPVILRGVPPNDCRSISVDSNEDCNDVTAKNDNVILFIAVNAWRGSSAVTDSQLTCNVDRAPTAPISIPPIVTPTPAPVTPTRAPVSPTSQPVTPTPNPTSGPTPVPTAKPTISCTSTEVLVRVDVQTDNWNHDSGFEIINDATDEIESKKAVGEYPYPNFLFEDQVCLGAGSYTVTFFDDWGDGICCGSGNGFFKVFIGDEDSPKFTSSSSAFEAETFTFEIVTAPSAAPSSSPSSDPSNAPSSRPSDLPSTSPSSSPTKSLQPSTSLQPSEGPSIGSTIVDIVCAVGSDFTKLCGYLTASGLAPALADGIWTVFAPSDDAFDEITDALLREVSEEKLKEVLLFHTIQRLVPSADLQCNGLLTMTNQKDSQTLCNGRSEPTFQVGRDNVATSFPAFIDTDISALNGVIHAVNNVMLPDGFFTEEPSSAPSQMPTVCRNIAAIVCDDPQLSSLCVFIRRFGLDDALEEGTWTLFAPNNAAFNGYNGGEVTKDIILFHAAARDGMRFNELQCNGQLPMANENGDQSTTICNAEGTPIFQSGEGNTSPPPNPAFVNVDIGACNGVIHVMNAIMLP